MNDDNLDVLLRDEFAKETAPPRLVDALRPRASGAAGWLAMGAIGLTIAATFGMVLWPPTLPTPEKPKGAAAGVPAASAERDVPPDRQIRDNMHGVHDCHAQALHEDPLIFGTIVVAWEVGEGGVSEAWIEDDGVESAPLRDCVLDWAAQLEFHGFAGEVRHPFDFRPAAVPSEAVAYTMEVFDITDLEDRIGLRDVEGIQPIPDGLQVDVDPLMRPRIMTEWGQQGTVELEDDALRLAIAVELKPVRGSLARLEVALTMNDRPTLEVGADVWPGQQVFAVVDDDGQRTFLVTIAVEAWEGDE